MPRAVHPHAGGEQARLRGRVPGGARFTPTQVGSRACTHVLSLSPPVHPHAGGEQTTVGASRAIKVGSPPRRWGAVGDQGRGVDDLRFTPTQVGSRSVARSITRRHAGSPPRRWGAGPWPTSRAGTRAVHPHAGGEQTTAGTCGTVYYGSPPRRWGAGNRTSGQVHQVGSPPRRWGAGVDRTGVGLLHRFTPTQVGSRSMILAVTASVSGSPPRRWGAGRGPAARAGARAVHPHAGGEQLFHCLTLEPHTGSPPRRWGAGYGHDGAGSHVGSPPRRWGAGQPCPCIPAGPRFTPTQVGSRPSRRGRSGRRPVHPHAGGEQADKTYTDGPGSRFTPTQVGSSRAWARSPPAPTVHPHAGGEQFEPPEQIFVPRGSPPRRWGADLITTGS